jgi:N-methylhydantoinase B
MGRVRVRHGVALAQQFAAGVVPQDLGGLPGEDQPVEHKGPMIMLGADSVIAWTGANNPGYGDPLARLPGAVARDVSQGWLDPQAATRVYGVAWGPGGMVDEAATGRLREQLLRARLAAAVAPDRSGDPDRAPDGAELRPVGGDLGVLLADGRPAEWVSLAGRARLGPVTGDYRTRCAVLQTPLGELAPEFATRPGRPGAAMMLREYLCPVTGRRLATEIIAAGDEPAADMVLGAP